MTNPIAAEARPEAQTEKPDELADPVKASGHWQIELQLADAHEKDWLNYGQKVQQRYKADRDTSDIATPSNVRQ